MRARVESNRLCLRRKGKVTRGWGSNENEWMVTGLTLEVRAQRDEAPGVTY